jgi:hypothetical protein
VANIVGRDTYIILGEQVERAEHLIVLNIEGPCSLEVTLECEHGGWLDVELFRGAHLADLPLVLGRDTGRTARSAAVVVVRVSVEVLLLVLVLTTVAEEL